MLGARALFGSIFGLSGADARLAAGVGAAIAIAVMALARPLLFASVDPVVAAPAGVRVRALGLVFLVLLGATAAEATQAVGALLMLGLLAAPAGARPADHRQPVPRARAVGACSALLAMWLGLALSYWIPSLPPSSAIVAVAAASYLLALLLGGRDDGTAGRGECPRPGASLRSGLETTRED